MKATGIVRRVDQLGRISVPMELRRMLYIENKDPLEVYVDDDDKIVLKKYEPAMRCVITDEIDEDNLVLANGEIILSKEGSRQLLKEIQETRQ